MADDTPAALVVATELVVAATRRTDGGLAFLRGEKKRKAAKCFPSNMSKTASITPLGAESSCGLKAHTRAHHESHTHTHHHTLTHVNLELPL